MLRLIQRNSDEHRFLLIPRPQPRTPTALLSAVLIAPLLISALGHAHCCTRSIVVHARITHAHAPQIMRPPTNQSIRRHLFDCSLTSRCLPRAPFVYEALPGHRKHADAGHLHALACISPSRGVALKCGSIGDKSLSASDFVGLDGSNVCDCLEDFLLRFSVCLVSLNVEEENDCFRWILFFEDRVILFKIIVRLILAIPCMIMSVRNLCIVQLFTFG